MIIDGACKCPGNQLLDNNNNICICPAQEQVADPTTGVCACPGNQVFTNNACSCPNQGEVVDANTGNCTCPGNQELNNNNVCTDPSKLKPQ